MEQLRTTRALPRGQRLARSCAFELPYCGCSRRLLHKSHIIGVLNDSLYDEPPRSKAWFWLHYAAPLRKAREQRQEWRRKAQLR